MAGTDVVMQCEKCRSHFATFDVFMRHACITGRGNDEGTASGTQMQDINADTDSLETSTNSVPSFWSESVTKLLLSEYLKRHDAGSGKITKKKMWMNIAAVLKEHGYEFSWEQVQGRWKTLTTAFKKMKDHNRKSGNDPRTCPYQKELEDILGKKPSCDPVATCSTSVSGEREEQQSEDTDSKSSEDGKNSENNDESPCCAKKKPRKTASAEVIEFLREQAGNQKQEKEADRKERKAMFDQKMEIIKTLIDVMKK